MDQPAVIKLMVFHYGGVQEPGGVRGTRHKFSGPDQDKERTFQDVGKRTSSLKLSYNLESTLVFVESCVTEFPESCDGLFLLARNKTDEGNFDSETSSLLSRLTEKIFHCRRRETHRGSYLQLHNQKWRLFGALSASLVLLIIVAFACCRSVIGEKQTTVND